MCTAEIFNKIIIERGAFVPLKDLKYVIEKIFIANPKCQLTIVEPSFRTGEISFALDFEVFEVFETLKEIQKNLKIAIDLDHLIHWKTTNSKKFIKNFLHFLKQTQVEFFSRNLDFLENLKKI
jgi:hypothetical protein